MLLSPLLVITVYINRDTAAVLLFEVGAWPSWWMHMEQTSLSRVLARRILDIVRLAGDAHIQYRYRVRTWYNTWYCVID